MPTLTEARTATRKNLAITFKPSVLANSGLLTIKAARCDGEFLVMPITTDFAGRAFILAKVRGKCGSDADATNYDVFIADAGSGEHDSCTCKGHTFRPNQPHGCKHIQAMRAVLANGWMEPAVAPVDAEEPVEAILARIQRVGAAHFEAEEAKRRWHGEDWTEFTFEPCTRKCNRCRINPPSKGLLVCTGCIRPSRDDSDQTTF